MVAERIALCATLAMRWTGCGGGVLSLCLEQQIDEEKKTTTKIRRGLRRPPMKENHTTINQKHAGATKEVKEGSCDQQGERGGSANQPFGGD
jgi:hypothetical protein